LTDAVFEGMSFNSCAMPEGHTVRGASSVVASARPKRARRLSWE
jgi:hypothetical protein